MYISPSSPLATMREATVRSHHNSPFRPPTIMLIDDCLEASLHERYPKLLRASSLGLLITSAMRTEKRRDSALLERAKPDLFSECLPDKSQKSNRIHWQFPHEIPSF